MKTTKKRLALIVEAWEYAAKMHKGSVFTTDFRVLKLLEKLTAEIQEMLAENLELREEIKAKVLHSKKKE